MVFMLPAAPWGFIRKSRKKASVTLFFWPGGDLGKAWRGRIYGRRDRLILDHDVTVCAHSQRDCAAV